ncbi:MULTISPECIES: c-type cytochrome [Heyndrickxia]|jgi:mono/diheme cytochrome c family protein|uniref:c-type cytochrome n=1 Tax=Heyndrickxia TaxID=2837504 RepID=UPI001B2C755A|nr:cytochrome c [Heyndrickxia oleronia]GIN40136.1 cytochrome c-551 [Heyndrickxia oleronia]
MKKTWISSVINLVLLVCLVFVLFIYKGPQPSQTAANASAHGTTASAGDPEGIVKKNCITCHGDNLQGGAGPELAKIGSKYDQGEIENIINNGKNGRMPAGLISKDDAKSVAEWLSQKK